MEATKPAAMAVAQAVEQELTVAGLKIDMGLGKIMRPALEMAYNELEMMSPSDDCKVHKYYQCLVDNGIAAEPWMAYQTTCEADTNCGIKYWTSTPEEDAEFFDAQDDLEDEIERKSRRLLKPIGESM